MSLFLITGDSSKGYGPTRMRTFAYVIESDTLSNAFKKLAEKLSARGHLEHRLIGEDNIITDIYAADKTLREHLEADGTVGGYGFVVYGQEVEVDKSHPHVVFW